MKIIRAAIKLGRKLATPSQMPLRDSVKTVPHEIIIIKK
jgi:hypothetical protein